jgi:hypothetical protein
MFQQPLDRMELSPHWRIEVKWVLQSVRNGSVV